MEKKDTNRRYSSDSQVNQNEGFKTRLFKAYDNIK
jgi:hypothetical protein